LRDQPAPGWTIDIAELGLPAGSTFSVSHPWKPGPIIKTDTPRAYLIARSPDPLPRWWLTSIDRDSGGRLFKPVNLGENLTTPKCFINQPDVVCLSDEVNAPASTARVIDGESGTLIYTGPSDIRLYTWMPLVAEQSGDFLITTAKKRGLYGVGNHAETTWSLPGWGVPVVIGPNSALEGRGSEESGSTVMFSLRDGSLLHTEFPSDAHMSRTKSFDGGFAGGFRTPAGAEFVQLFDDNGKLISKKRLKGMLVDTNGRNVSGNLITVLESDRLSIYDSHANKLLEIPGDQQRRTVLIGSTLWVSQDSDHKQFRPYDVRTGKAGEPCAINLDYLYIGTDGHVAINAPVDPKSAVLAEAYDLKTCKKVWSITRPRGFTSRVIRLGDNLVRVSDDGTQVYSMVNR